MENVIELVKCPLCGTYNVLPLNRAGRTGVEICAPCLLPVPVSFKVPAREYAVIRRKANQRVCVYCLNGDHEVPGQFDCTCKCHGNGRTT